MIIKILTEGLLRHQSKRCKNLVHGPLAATPPEMQ